jgi:hypothetical protein
MTTLKVYNRQFASGLIFLCIGIFAAFYALQYRLGSATSMGPGYFPLGVALVLTTLGLLTMLGGLRDASKIKALRGRIVKATAVDEPGIVSMSSEDDLEPAEFKLGMLVIIFGVIVFGEVLRLRGLVPAVGILTVLICYKRWRSRPIEVIVLAVLLMAVTAGLFVYLLGMPFPLFKS